MLKLAFLTPSYINSQERADYARRSLESLKEAFGTQYTHIVVDDIPHFKGRFIHRFADWRYRNLAEKIYQGENIQLIRQDGGNSISAMLRAAQEAKRTGFELVFSHLDDMVYTAHVRDLMRFAVNSFQQVPDLQMIRFTGIPILSQACTPQLGNRTELTISENKVQFENVTLSPQCFEDYTLWWSTFHPTLAEGRYYPISMWFAVYRTSFLIKLLTLNETVKNLRTLGEVEQYYKENWRDAVEQLDGKLGYINMQFGGLEMQRNPNWQALINLPNEPV